MSNIKDNLQIASEQIAFLKNNENIRKFFDDITSLVNSTNSRLDTIENKIKILEKNLFDLSDTNKNILSVLCSLIDKIELVEKT